MEFKTWQEVFIFVIMLIALFFGAPIIQLFKNLLTLIFKKKVEYKWAVLLAVIVSVGLALLEMWLNGQLKLLTVTPQTLPMIIGTVFGVAQIYYNLFKKDAGTLGQGALLKPPADVIDVVAK